MKYVTRTVTALRLAIYAISIVAIGGWSWDNYTRVKKRLAEEPQKSTTVEQAPRYIQNRSNHLIVVTVFTSASVDENGAPKNADIEKFTKAALSSKFPQALASKEIIVQTIDFSQPEHAHFKNDYGITTDTIVISERKKGAEFRWTKHDNLLNLLSTPEKFALRIQEITSTFLK